MATLEHPIVESSAPDDELYSEFQSYVRSLYETATAQSVQELDAGVGKALTMLDAGLKRAVAEVEANSGSLAKAVGDAQSDFRQMFEPIFEDYRRRLLQDQMQFVDLLAGKLVPTMQDQYKMVQDASKSGGERLEAALQNRFEALRNTVAEKVGQIQASEVELGDRVEAASRKSNTLISEVSEKVVTELDRAVTSLEQRTQAAAERSLAAQQKNAEKQFAQLNALGMRLSVLCALAILISGATLFMVMRGR